MASLDTRRDHSLGLREYQRRRNRLDPGRQPPSPLLVRIQRLRHGQFPLHARRRHLGRVQPVDRRNKRSLLCGHPHLVPHIISPTPSRHDSRLAGSSPARRLFAPGPCPLSHHAPAHSRPATVLLERARTPLSDPEVHFCPDPRSLRVISGADPNSHPNS